MCLKESYHDVQGLCSVWCWVCFCFVQRQHFLPAKQIFCFPQVSSCQMKGLLYFQRSWLEEGELGVVFHSLNPEVNWSSLEQTPVFPLSLLWMFSSIQGETAAEVANIQSDKKSVVIEHWVRQREKWFSEKEWYQLIYCSCNSMEFLLALKASFGESRYQR